MCSLAVSCGEFDLNEIILAKVLITTVPFGDKDRLPLDLLEKAGIEYQINPFGKKITEKQPNHLASVRSGVIIRIWPFMSPIIYFVIPNLMVLCATPVIVSVCFPR